MKIRLPKLEENQQRHSRCLPNLRCRFPATPADLQQQVTSNQQQQQQTLAVLRTMIGVNLPLITRWTSCCAELRGM